MASLLFAPDGSLRNGCKVLLFALAAGFCNSAAFTLPWLGPGDSWLPAPWFSFAAFLGLTWFALRMEGRPLASVGLRLDRRWARQFLLGALAGAGLMALMALPGLLGGSFRLARNPQASGSALLTGAWLYLSVAFSEELLFRGYLFQRLHQGIGRWPAQLLIALLFAGVHWGNPGMTGATRAWASLDIAIAAILLGLCYLRTGSLAMPIGLHLGWNWTQGTLLGFSVSGIPSTGWWRPEFHGQAAWLTGGSFGLEASLPCAMVAAAASMVLAIGLPDK
ncbi:MAG: type II CAAX endopeptidase family protein [Holophaga sp.]|nr:type II CAAX endopeptidase family protein [Holophaga sp.]